MSKPVKELLRKELINRLEGVDSLAIVDLTGIDGQTNYLIRGRLRDKGISLTVVKNSLARQAFKLVGLDSACELLDGPCALVCGGDSVVDVVRELLDIGTETEQLEVKGAVLEGEAYGADRIAELSKYPTRDEALANVVACALAPGARLAGALKGPAGKIAALIKAIEEKCDSDDSDEAAAA